MYPANIDYFTDEILSNEQECQEMVNELLGVPDECYQIGGHILGSEPAFESSNKSSENIVNTNDENVFRY